MNTGIDRPIQNRLFDVALKASMALAEEIEMFGSLTAEDIDAYEQSLKQFEDVGWFVDPTGYRDIQQSGRMNFAKEHIAIVRAILPMTERALRFGSNGSQEAQDE